MYTMTFTIGFTLFSRDSHLAKALDAISIRATALIPRILPFALFLLQHSIVVHNIYTTHHDKLFALCRNVVFFTVRC